MSLYQELGRVKQTRLSLSPRQGAWTLPYLQARGCQAAGGSTRLLQTIFLFYTDSQRRLGQITYPLVSRLPWLAGEWVDSLGNLTGLPALIIGHLHTTNPPSLDSSFLSLVIMELA